MLTDSIHLKKLGMSSDEVEWSIQEEVTHKGEVTCCKTIAPRLNRTAGGKSVQEKASERGLKSPTSVKQLKKEAREHE